MHFCLLFCLFLNYFSLKRLIQPYIDFSVVGMELPFNQELISLCWLKHPFILETSAKWTETWDGLINCKISGTIYQLNSLLFCNEKTLSLIGQTCLILMLFSHFFCDGKYSVVIFGQDDSFRQEIQPRGLAL